MSDELLCAEGHVIDGGKELCSRCNGAAVNKPAPEVEAEPEAEAKVEEKAAEEVAAESETIPEVEAVPEVAPEQPPVDNDHVAEGSAKFDENGNTAEEVKAE